ncbi:MAG: phosphatase PAP2 family protein [Oscillospiraceae bacterium]|nr:phosphatase PAP2 family protein [Oscillospiraceae bacterium]
MDILYMFESIRKPVLDELMLFITHFGEETFFLIAALIVFWCVDKYKGYYLLTVGFVGTILSQFMKLWFCVPRPWVQDENFTIVEEARAEATGYSFPSGHSQNAVGTFGSIAVSIKQKWIKVIAICIAILVPLSRMYLGVHTPQDVLVGSALSLGLILLFKPLLGDNAKKYLTILLPCMTVLAIAYLCFVKLYRFPVDIDADNLASGIKNAYTLLGCIFGFLVVFIIDEKWLYFKTDAVWWAQIIKLVLGFLLVLCVKSGLKQPLELVFGEYAGRAVRYGLMVIVAGILWPLTFKWFSSLGKKEW